jgi:hypothetical protein
VSDMPPGAHSRSGRGNEAVPDRSQPRGPGETSASSSGRSRRWRPVRRVVSSGVGLLVVASVVATMTLAGEIGHSTARTTTSTRPSTRSAATSGSDARRQGSTKTNSTSQPSHGASTTSTVPLPRPGASPVTHPVLGVDLYSTVDLSTAETITNGARLLAAAKQELGITSVGIVWDFYMPSSTSNEISEGPASMSLADVVDLTKLAERDGLSVEYRPLIKVGPNLSWDGGVLPSNQSEWFGRFYETELPFFRAAAHYHVREFAIETELVKLNSSPGWASFVAKAEIAAPGVIISYAASTLDFFPSHPAKNPRLLLPTEAYGDDAYMPMPASISSSASASQVEAGWDGYFDHVPAALLHQTVLDEVGIAGVDGAYQHPSNWNLQGTPNVAVQVNWFTAACNTVARFKMRGIYFYNINLQNNPLHWPQSPVVFMGKPAVVAAIRHCAAMFEQSFS